MKTPGIKSTDAAVWSNTWSDSRSTGSRKGGGEGSGGKGADKAAAPQTRTDEITFSQKLEQGQQEKNPADTQMKQLLNVVEESNDKLRDMLGAIKPLKVETTPVPSAIGLSVNAAANKLKASDLKVSGVAQEFSLTVPEGHVISQVPGPGSRSAKRGGIRLVISKGPPPEKEKHETVRHRETVALPPDQRDIRQEEAGQNAAVTPPDSPTVKLSI